MPERSLEASPRRRAELRARIGRPESAELTFAALLGVLLFALSPLATELWTSELALWSLARDAAGSALDRPWALLLAGARDAVSSLAVGVVAMSCALALAGAGAVLLQRGAPRWFFAPAPEVREAGEARTDLASTGLAFAKWLALSASLLWPLRAAAPALLDSGHGDAEGLAEIAARVGGGLLQRAWLAFLVLGALDLGAQAWLRRRRARMTPRELRQEHRISEGDPHLRAERRRRAHELRGQFTLREVGELALLVVDSDARAVGLRLAPAGVASGPRTADARALPVVWIKVEGELAQRLRSAASAVPVLADPALAAALWAFELNEPLPAALRARLPARLAERRAPDGLP